MSDDNLNAAQEPNIKGTFAQHDFSTGEEIAHAITHGLGVLSSVAALVVMVIWSLPCHNPLLMVGSVVFGSSMIILYSASTFFHALTAQRAKRFFKLMDHGAIYLLIAGTYTPFALAVLTGPWGWWSLVVIWVLAALGIFYEVVLDRPWKKLSLAFYLILGWLLVITWLPLSKILPSQAMVLLATGGLSYTAGALFYAWRGFAYHHAVWHLFVLLGTGLHFWCVLQFIIMAC